MSSRHPHSAECSAYWQYLLNSKSTNRVRSRRAWPRVDQRTPPKWPRGGRLAAPPRGVLDTTSNELQNESRDDPSYRRTDGRPLDAQLNVLTPILLPKSIFLALVLLQLPVLLTLTLSCCQ